MLLAIAVQNRSVLARALRLIFAASSICFFLLLSVAKLSAQIPATTQDGKAVELFDDGHWEFVEPNEPTPALSAGESSCEEFIMVHEDVMEGTMTLAGKESLVISQDGGTEGIAFLMLNPDIPGKHITVISIVSVGASRCIDDDDEIVVLFTDGTRMTLDNRNEFNCQGKSKVYVGGFFTSASTEQTLISKTIQRMRVKTSDGFVEEEFSAEQGEQFRRTLECLRNKG